MAQLTFRILVLAATGLLAAASAGVAASSSQGKYSSVRLIRGSGDASTLKAGIEIKLAPGWKTYWRYPGDSGVPPRFDFSNSENLASAQVLWPAPMRFEDPGGTSIGYASDIVLPLRITPRDAAKPVLLRAQIDYAICEKVCVPIDAVLDLKLDRAGAESAAIAASEQRVPQPGSVGAEAPLAIASIRKDQGSPARVVVEVKAPSREPVDLFVEGPDADWSLPVPTHAEGPAGSRQFVFALDGAPPGKTFDGITIRLTAVSRSHAIETTVHID